MLIIGHRGVTNALTPENSLSAIELALLEGADGVEVDVRVTSDGVAVCYHDDTLMRLSGDPRAVAGLTYGELATIGRHRIPLLSEVLDLVEGRGRLVLDVKVPAHPAVAADTVEAVAAVLRRQRPELVTVSSFDRARILQLRNSGVRVRTALLGRPGLPLALLLRRAMDDGHDEAHAHLSSLLMRPDLIDMALHNRIAITGWTVNEPTDLRELAAAGLPAVITDEPALARRALRRTLVSV